MVRVILGIVVGLVVAFVTVAAVEYVGGLLFPVADPIDLTQATTAGGWVDRMPLAAKLLVAAGWLLGALAGAFAAGRIARRRAIGWVPVVLVVVAGIANITMIPHPLWMSLAAVLAPMAGGWIGVRLARARS